MENGEETSCDTSQMEATLQEIEYILLESLELQYQLKALLQHSEFLLYTIIFMMGVIIICMIFLRN